VSFWDSVGKWFDETEGNLGAAWSNAFEDSDDTFMRSMSTAVKENAGVSPLTPMDLAGSASSVIANAGAKYVAARDAASARDTGIAPFDWLRKTSFYQHPEENTLGTLSRGIAAAMINDPFNGGNPLSFSDWKRSIALTGTHTVEGQEVRGITFGNLVAGDLGKGPKRGGLGDGMNDSLAAAQQRKVAYDDSWSGKILSGVLDVAISFVSPATGIAKAGTAARMQGGLVRTGEAGATMDSARALALVKDDVPPTAAPDTLPGLDVPAGIDPVARIEPLAEVQVDRVAARINEMSDWVMTNQAQPALIANHDFLKGSSERGTLAYMFSQAESKDDVLDLIGTVINDPNSAKKLIDRRADLAEQLHGFGSVTDETLAIEKYLVDGHGQTFLNLANSKVDSDIAHREQDIMEEMARLDRVLAIRGEQEFIPTTYNWRGEDLIDDDGLMVSELRNGLSGRVVSVAKYQLGTRLSGHINIADPSEGYAQLNNLLRQARYVSGTMRAEIMADFARAASDSARQTVVMNAEGAVVKGIAKEYDLTEELAAQILKEGTARRAPYRDMMAKRAYSAAPGQKLIAVADPESGQIVIRETAHLRSQIQDFVPFIDPNHVDKMLREATDNQTLDIMFGRKAGDRLHSVTDPMSEFARAKLMTFTRGWKDAQLIPRALPYIQRNQIDGQLRLITTMGGQAYAREAHAIATMGAKGARIIAGKARQVLKPTGKGFEDDDYAAVVTEHLKSARINLPGGKTAPAFDPDDIDQAIRNVRATGGSHVDLGSELANVKLQQYRASGDYDVIKPGDPAHMDSYLAAFRQMQYSPISLAIAEGKSMRQLVDFVRRDAGANEEWLNVMAGWHGSMEDWLRETRKLVNFYLPTPELREFLVGRQAVSAVPDSTQKINLYPEGPTAWAAGPPNEKGRVAWKEGPALYHGAAKRFNQKALAADPSLTSGSGNILGSGLAAIDHPDIARKFMTKDTGALYSIQWKGDKKPKILNLETSAIKDLRTWVSKTLKSVNGPQEAKDALVARIADSAVSDRKVLVELRAYMTEAGMAKSDIDKSFADLTKRMSKRWDAVRHSSGIPIEGGDKPHSVLVFLDRSKVSANWMRTSTSRHVPGKPGVDATEPRDFTSDDYNRFFDPQNGTVTPMQVHGKGYNPLERSDADSYWQEARTRIYSLISDAPENVMVRFPLYKWDYQRQLQRLVESHPAPVLSQEDFGRYRVVADRLARKTAKRTLFDSSDVTNLAHTMRFIAPFWGAWEDVMKKWGRQFYDNPAALMRLNTVWQIPNRMNLVEDDRGYRANENGDRYSAATGYLVKAENLIGKREGFILPAGPIGEWLHEKNFWWDKGSFNSVFQGEHFWLPGFGPLVAVPTNEVIKRIWPEAATDPIIESILPYGTSNKGPVDQNLPAWARQAHNAFGNTDDHKNVFSNFYKQVYAEYQAEHDLWVAGGKVGEEPQEPRPDAAANRTRNHFLLRVLSGLTMPFSVTPKPEFQFYIDQANAMRQQYGSPATTPEYKAKLATYVEKYGKATAEKHLLTENPELRDWRTRFMEQYPEYYNFAIQLSTSESGVNMNLASVTAYEQYGKELQNLANPDSAAAILGPDTAYGLDDKHAYSDSARDYMLTHGLRRIMEPGEALKKAEADKGWVQYQQVRTKVDLILESRGLTSLNQKGADDLQKILKDFVTELGAENRYWYKDYGDRSTTSTQTFLADVNKATIRNKELAARPDMVAMAQYIEVRNKIRAKLDERGLSQIDSKGAEDLAAVWDQFSASLGAETPGFGQVWTRYLETDKVVGRIG
jgi:hypothetical protein